MNGRILQNHIVSSEETGVESFEILPLLKPSFGIQFCYAILDKTHSAVQDLFLAYKRLEI